MHEVWAPGELRQPVQLPFAARTLNTGRGYRCCCRSEPLPLSGSRASASSPQDTPPRHASDVEHRVQFVPGGRQDVARLPGKQIRAHVRSRGAAVKASRRIAADCQCQRHYVAHGIVLPCDKSSNSKWIMPQHITAKSDRVYFIPNRGHCARRTSATDCWQRSQPSRYHHAGAASEGKRRKLSYSRSSAHGPSIGRGFKSRA